MNMIIFTRYFGYEALKVHFTHLFDSAGEVVEEEGKVDNLSSDVLAAPTRKSRTDAIILISGCGLSMFSEDMTDDSFEVPTMTT